MICYMYVACAAGWRSWRRRSCTCHSRTRWTLHRASTPGHASRSKANIWPLVYSHSCIDVLWTKKSIAWVLVNLQFIYMVYGTVKYKKMYCEIIHFHGHLISWIFKSYTIVLNWINILLGSSIKGIPNYGIQETRIPNNKIDFTVNHKSYKWQGQHYHQFYTLYIHFYHRYRGLKSFRTSPWDPKENLPLDYARIFQFSDFCRMTRKMIKTGASEEEDMNHAALVSVYILASNTISSYLLLCEYL